jgi:hypothetical protein
MQSITNDAPGCQLLAHESTNQLSAPKTLTPVYRTVQSVSILKVILLHMAASPLDRQNAVFVHRNTDRGQTLESAYCISCNSS